MKRMTIIKEDNMVGIDGKFFQIDCSALPSNFHALQWYEDDNYGEIEWSGKPTRPRNTPISSLQDYQEYIDKWNAKYQEYLLWEEQNNMQQDS